MIFAKFWNTTQAKSKTGKILNSEEDHLLLQLFNQTNLGGY